MKDLHILNDLHIGALRSAGTTIQSAKALREFAVANLVRMLGEIDSDLVIAGDLFDSFNVPLSEVLSVKRAFSQWLSKGHNLCLIPGNHDLSKDSSKLSSFEFLGELLLDHPNVKYLRDGGWVVEGKVYAISHVANQDLFDYELSKVPECEALILHCNWDNGFAKESDHSLNLEASVAKTLPVKRIIMAHEHAAARHLEDKVFVMGNQFPMSISDCLSKQSKTRTILKDGGVMEAVQTWDRMNYQEVDWRDLSTATAKFVRVVGTAEEVEATDAVEAVSSLRRLSEAFIITSAVRIGGGAEIDMSEALASVESVRTFDVMGALREILTPEQVKVVEGLK